MSQGPATATWWRRALRVGVLSFLLAALVSYASGLALGRLPAAVAFLVVLVLIAIGVGFDIVGTSVTAADQTPLHAMGAKRIHGSRQALWLVRNADRVANFANDVVGDVSGAVAGAAGATVALRLTVLTKGGETAGTLISLAVVGLIAGLAVGGKAAGKSFAITHATDVVFAVGRMIFAVERLLGRSLTGGKTAGPSKRRTT